MPHLVRLSGSRGAALRKTIYAPCSFVLVSLNVQRAMPAEVPLVECQQSWCSASGRTTGLGKSLVTVRPEASLAQDIDAPQRLRGFIFTSRGASSLLVPLSQKPGNDGIASTTSRTVESVRDSSPGSVPQTVIGAFLRSPSINTPCDSAKRHQ